MKTKILTAALLAASAWGFILTDSPETVPSDLRDAVSDVQFDTKSGGLKPEDLDTEVPEPKAAPAKAAVQKAEARIRPVEFIPIPGGKFIMGTNSREKGFEFSAPAHEVTIKAFGMAKTHVTVEQYAECVSAGQCSLPKTGYQCNWGKPGYELHPINCVNWHQASQYAKFKGARLPSESEWEYAARSCGKNVKYPWGNSAPTDDNAVTNVSGHYSGTRPVCSKTGNTAQGLCDMAGNVWQWVQDEWQTSYHGAPADGRAFEPGGLEKRVVRGGSFADDGALFYRSGLHVQAYPAGYSVDNVGFRIAR